METQNIDPKQAKKTRNRRKAKINEIRLQMEFYFSDSNLTKDRFLNQLVANDPSKLIGNLSSLMHGKLILHSVF